MHADLINRAAGVVMQGGIIVYPTETLYGIGASINNGTAIQRVLKIKSRDSNGKFKPISVAVSNYSMIEELAGVDEFSHSFIKRFMPGPVTALMPCRNDADTNLDALTGGKNLVGLRFPDHPVATGIIDISGPITSTSANSAGGAEPRTIKDIDADVAGAVDMLVNGGPCKYGAASTVVNLADKKVVRRGVMCENIEAYISSHR